MEKNIKNSESIGRALDNQFLKTFFTFVILSQRDRVEKKNKMSHETLNRLLEYSHTMIATEVKNHYVPRNELFPIFLSPISMQYRLSHEG